MTIDSSYIKLPVDYLKQPDEYACVPTMLAMLFRHRDISTSPQTVISEFEGYDPLAGCTWEDTERYCTWKRVPMERTTGLLMPDIVRLLEHNVPVAASIPNFSDGYPHVVVLHGHNRKEFFMHDPYDAIRKEVSFSEFSWRWKERDNMLLYLPPK
ncbi:TPA: hypothetical protein HA251_00685 [Candidatus Woesearchaeota archaeon]|nr:hypothetical protein [Candidatus Woesearchaeota archaeon]